MKIIYFLIVISISLSACYADRDIEIIQAGGFEYDQDRQTLLFLNTDIGFAGGKRTITHYDSTGAYYFTSHAAIWRTENGGRNWETITIDEASNISIILEKNNEIYAIARGFSDDDHYSLILKSSDMGSSWRVLCERPGIILKPYIRDSLHFYYWGDKLNVTHDGGKTWQTDDKPMPKVGDVFYDGDTAYFLSPANDTSYPYRLIAMNLDSKDLREIKLPPGRRGGSLSKQNMFLLYENDQFGAPVELYRIQGDSVVLLSKFYPGKYHYYPKFIDSDGDKIYLYYTLSVGGFGGYRGERLLVSNDDGLSWDRIHLGMKGIWPAYDCICTLSSDKHYALYYEHNVLNLGIVKK